MKRRVVAIGLVVFAAWPLVHRGLVAAYDVSPWKLYGWAMYTAPAFSATVAILEVRPTGPALVPETRLSVRVRREQRRLAGHRRTLGRLASPEALGRALAEDHPELEWVLVAVQTRWLDRGTATIQTETEKHLYHRGAPVSLDRAPSP